MIRSSVAAMLSKDLRENGPNLMILVGATAVILMLMARTYDTSAYGQGSMAIVAAGIKSILPLCAAIVGNILVARELILKTRHFLTALPIHPWVMLVEKYALGLALVVVIGLVTIAVGLLHAGVGDDLDAPYVAGIGVRVIAISLLVWSIAFFVSLCGRLRLLLYVLLFVGYLILNKFDQVTGSFAPLRLLDSELLVYERDVMPWSDILVTVVLGIAISASGFALAWAREGTLIDTLAVPMTRIDITIVCFVLMTYSLVVAIAVNDVDELPMLPSATQMVQNETPDIYVYYEHEENRKEATSLLARLSTTLESISHNLGVDELPLLRIRYSANLFRDVQRLNVSSEVSLDAHIAGLSPMGMALVESVAVHGIFQQLTNNRAMYEPHHWVTDAQSWWWATRHLSGEQKQAVTDELLALASISVAIHGEVTSLIDQYDQIVDIRGAAAADALAYSALVFLESEIGEEGIYRLGRQFLTQPVKNNYLSSFIDARNSSRQRFNDATGLDFDQFSARWQQWLETVSAEPRIKTLVDSVPAAKISVQSDVEHNGYKRLVTQLVGEITPTQSKDGHCRLRHAKTGPTRNFVTLDGIEEVTISCATDGSPDRTRVPYATGDRAYVALYYENDLFSRPVQLGAQRVTIK